MTARLIFATLFYCAGIASASAAVQFQLIADTSTAIPAGQWQGQNFAQFSSSGVDWPPAIDRGDVIFVGKPATGFMNGAFTWSAAAGVRLLADPSVAIPDRGGAKFSEIRYPSVDGGEFAFSSYDGIYRTVGGNLTTVIDPSTVVPPGNAPFGGSSAPALDGPNTWFFAELNDAAFTEGVFRHNSGAISMVAQEGMPTPSQLGRSMTSLNSNVSGAAGKVAFAATSTGTSLVRGIYLYDGATVERVADTTMAAPVAGGALFSHLYNFPITTDGDSVGFVGEVGGQTGIFRRLGGTLQAVAVNGQPAPGGGSFSLFGQFSSGVSVDGGHVAIADRNAIYTDYFGSLTRILKVGDQLFGRTVTSLDIGTQALSRHHIAFRATFSNGQAGVFVANLPEPGSAALLATTLFSICLRRPKR